MGKLRDLHERIHQAQPRVREFPGLQIPPSSPSIPPQADLGKLGAAEPQCHGNSQPIPALALDRSRSILRFPRSARRTPGEGDSTFVTIIHLIEFQLAGTGDGGSGCIRGKGELVGIYVTKTNFRGSACRNILEVSMRGLPVFSAFGFVFNSWHFLIYFFLNSGDVEQRGARIWAG